MRKIALHWQIIIGLFLGLLYGIISIHSGYETFTSNWITFGTIFINLLKFIAMPLVLGSLVTGVASLNAKLSRIGATIAIYPSTTFSVTICLSVSV